MENLLNYKGRGFAAKIHKGEVKGKIQVEDGRAFLCQDEWDGADCKDKLGYKYSWVVGAGTLADFGKNHVTDFRITFLTPAEIEAYKDWRVGDVIVNHSTELTVIFRSGELVACKNMDGRATVNFTCDELYQEGWRLKADPVEPEPVELTMDQIAEKFGVAVENLKIKKD